MLVDLPTAEGLLVTTIYRVFLFFFFSSRRRHTRFDCDWSSDVCSSDLVGARSDPAGVQHPLPADHDDHHGGADGYAADRARRGSGLRVTATAGDRRGGRPGVFAVHHAVRDARDLHLLGRAARASQEPRALQAGADPPAARSDTGGLTAFS